MEDLLAFVSENRQWLWLGIGIFLLAGELIIPGVFLLWIGIAATAVGILTLFLQDIGFVAEGAFFVVLTIVLIYIAHKFFYGESGEPAFNGLNARAGAYVGQVYTVATAIRNGRGQIRVGDTLWLAGGPDLEEGARARVVAAQGTLLIVEPVED